MDFHLVIATGSPSGDARKTETFEWHIEDDYHDSYDSFRCDLPDYPIGIQKAVHVMLEGNNYACGGQDQAKHDTTQCYNILTGDEAPFNLLHKSFCSISDHQ